MRRIRDLPIRRKLLLLIMTVTGTAILLVSAVTLTYDSLATRRAMEGELDALARVIASNASAALSFLDEEAALQILASLEAQTPLVEARILDARGELFASYTRDGSEPARVAGAGGGVLPRHLVAERPIRAGQERIGTIRLVSDTSVLRKRIIHSAGAVAGVAGAALVLALLLSSWLERLLSERLRQLADAARRVSEARDYTVRVSCDGADDEVGHLIGTFNEMLGQIQQRDAALERHGARLEETVERRTRELREANERLHAEMTEREELHKKYVRASREAGMAQVATSVLHNVGNVLNSINVSASVVSDRVRQSRVPGLARATGLLAEHRGDLGRFLEQDEAGRNLPPYLEALAQHLTQEQADLVQELESLRQNVEHVKEVISTQQSYARRTRLFETLALESVVEEAIRINQAGIGRHGVELVRDYEPVPAVTVDRNRLLEILINLVSNAKYALSHNREGERTLTVSIGASPTRPGHARVCVRDAGVGIAAEDLPKIFSYGFTTREDGHGFGLHSAALAAQEMHGSIWAESDGPGGGAAFTLEIPMQPPDEKEQP